MAGFMEKMGEKLHMGGHEEEEVHAPAGGGHAQAYRARAEHAAPPHVPILYAGGAYGEHGDGHAQHGASPAYHGGEYAAAQQHREGPMGKIKNKVKGKKGERGHDSSSSSSSESDGEGGRRKKKHGLF